MTPDRFREITAQYPKLRVAIVGDFCLDRYLEIDPFRAETSIETGLPVRNVVGLRALPGGGGTILNNLVALGVGEIIPISFCGDDGEGFELRRALGNRPGVNLDHFVTSPERRTFTYCKPLVIEPGKEPVELNRLDSKNWTPTPEPLRRQLADSVRRVSREIDALIVLEQTDVAETGVVTRDVLAAIGEVASANPNLPILADSRRGMTDWPGLSFKMNAVELASMLGGDAITSVDQVRSAALDLARRARRPVFVTLSEQGLVGASSSDGQAEHVPALPVRGPIDIVGAGDSVTANLATALSAGATIREALTLAAIASSIVIHQLGTTGTASVADLETLLPQTSHG